MLHRRDVKLLRMNDGLCRKHWERWVDAVNREVCKSEQVSRPIHIQ